MCADFSDLFYTRAHTDAHTDAHGCKHMHSLTWMVGWSDGLMWSPGALSTSSGPVATSTTTGAGRKPPLAIKNQCPLDAVALCFLLTAALLMTSSHSEGPSIPESRSLSVSGLHKLHIICCTAGAGLMLVLPSKAAPSTLLHPRSPCSSMQRCSAAGRSALKRTTLPLRIARCWCWLMRNTGAR